MFDCKLIAIRGRLEAAAEAELSVLGPEGHEIVAAYPIKDVVATMITHQFVLRRTIVTCFGNCSRKEKGRWAPKPSGSSPQLPAQAGSVTEFRRGRRGDQQPPQGL